MHFKRTSYNTTSSMLPARIQPSRALRKLVNSFFQLADRSPQDAPAVARLQDVLLEAMRAERIPYNSAQEALWIARWLYVGEPQTPGRNTRIMFARAPQHAHITEYDPIRDGVNELTSVPFESVEQERAIAERFIPVLVTVEPLCDFPGATYER